MERELGRQTHARTINKDLLDRALAGVKEEDTVFDVEGGARGCLVRDFAHGVHYTGVDEEVPPRGADPTKVDRAGGAERLDHKGFQARWEWRRSSWYRANGGEGANDCGQLHDCDL